MSDGENERTILFRVLGAACGAVIGIIVGVVAAVVLHNIASAMFEIRWTWVLAIGAALGGMLGCLFPRVGVFMFECVTFLWP